MTNEEKLTILKSKLHDKKQVLGLAVYGIELNTRTREWHHVAKNAVKALDAELDIANIEAEIKFTLELIDEETREVI